MYIQKLPLNVLEKYYTTVFTSNFLSIIPLNMKQTFLSLSLSDSRHQGPLPLTVPWSLHIWILVLQVSVYRAHPRRPPLTPSGGIQ